MREPETVDDLETPLFVVGIETPEVFRSAETPDGLSHSCLRFFPGRIELRSARGGSSEIQPRDIGHIGAMKAGKIEVWLTLPDLPRSTRFAFRAGRLVAEDLVDEMEDYLVQRDPQGLFSIAIRQDLHYSRPFELTALPYGRETTLEVCGEIRGSSPSHGVIALDHVRWQFERTEDTGELIVTRDPSTSAETLPCELVVRGTRVFSRRGVCLGWFEVPSMTVLEFHCGDGSPVHRIRGKTVRRDGVTIGKFAQSADPPSVVSWRRLVLEDPIRELPAVALMLSELPGVTRVAPPDVIWIGMRSFAISLPVSLLTGIVFGSIYAIMITIYVLPFVVLSLTGLGLWRHTAIRRRHHQA